MGESDTEAGIFISPLQRALTPLPFHRVRMNTIDRTQPHLVELALLSHSFNRESHCVTILYALHAEIEPGSIVTNVAVRQPVAIHVTRHV